LGFVAIALTRQEFIDAYPEFGSVKTPSFESHKERALLQLSEATWGAERGLAALKLLVAHQLAMSPGGEKARIKLEGGQVSSVYYEDFKRLAATLGPFEMLV
jgi:hypothetical protein